MDREHLIVHENGNFWVRFVRLGYYEILRSYPTHSVKVGTVHFDPSTDARARERAIEECNRRAAAE